MSDIDQNKFDKLALFKTRLRFCVGQTSVQEFCICASDQFRMSKKFNMSVWVDEMLGDTAATQDATATTSESSTPALPAPTTPPCVVVPLSDTLTAYLMPKSPSDLSPEARPDNASALSSPHLRPGESLPDSFVDTERAPKPWEKDPVYSEWVPYIDKPLEAMRDVRGDFLRDVNMATLFGGVSSERKCVQLFSIPHKWCFSCDKKATAIAFSDMNFSRPDVHFIDGLDFLESDEGRNLFEGNEMASLKQFVNAIDILFVSTSCRPFSSARSKRKSEGSANHEDMRLLDVFFRAVLIIKPGCIVFEQVFGFALSESVDDPVSPMQRFLERCEQELKEYEWATFAVDGDMYLIFVRHRIFIIFVRKDYGGKDTLEAVKMIVKAN